MKWPHARIGGVHVDLLHEQEALERFDASLRDEARPVAVESANLDHLHWFPRGSHDRGIDYGFDWLTLMDGTPLVLMARRVTGRKSLPRLTGADLLEPMLEIAQERGASLGVFGGSTEMHQRLAGVLREKFPDLEVAGMWSPDRASLSDPARAHKWAQVVGDSGAVVVVVTLGKPRQERWIRAYGLETGARALLAFGGAADFMAGTTKRAPELYQKYGLEWAYRLAQEPQRLARRYLVQGPRAAVKLVRHSKDTSP